MSVLADRRDGPEARADSGKEGQLSLRRLSTQRTGRLEDVPGVAGAPGTLGASLYPEGVSFPISKTGIIPTSYGVKKVEYVHMSLLCTCVWARGCAACVCMCTYEILYPVGNAYGQCLWPTHRLSQ